VGHQGVGRYPAEAAGLEVLDGLADLGPGVHHKRAVVFDMFADRLTAEDEDFEVLRARVLCVQGPNAQPVAGAEGDQLTGADGVAFGAGFAGAGEDVGERVERGGSRAAGGGIRG
jgi:hypothetical protein